MTSLMPSGPPEQHEAERGQPGEQAGGTEHERDRRLAVVVVSASAAAAAVPSRPVVASGDERHTRRRSVGLRLTLDGDLDPAGLALLAALDAGNQIVSPGWSGNFMLSPKSVNSCGDSGPPVQLTAVAPSVIVSPSASTGCASLPSVFA